MNSRESFSIIICNNFDVVYFVIETCGEGMILRLGK